jgi:hypothetical protein
MMGRMGRMGGMGRLLLPLLLAGCSEAGSSAARTRVFDSAGITIVDNSDAHAPDIATWSVDSVPILRIGREDSSDAYRFDGVYDIARLSDSTIVVAEGSPSIRFFDKHGQFLHAVGRRGDGPGEYRVISMMRRIHGDSLLVWDFGNLRITTLTPGGDYQRSEHGLLSVAYFFARDAFADGALLGTASNGISSAPPGILHIKEAVVRFDPGSGAVDTLAQIPTSPSYVMGGTHFNMTSIPYSAGVLAIVAGQSAYVGSSAKFEIGRYDERGRLLRSVRLDRIPEPLGEDIRNAYITRALSRARADADRERLKAQFGEVPFPEALPAVGALAVDVDSNLWVSSYATSDSLPTQWTIFDPEGRLLAETVTPAHFRVSEIGSSDIIGVRADSLGIEQVQVLGIRKPE